MSKCIEESTSVAATLYFCIWSWDGGYYQASMHFYVLPADRNLAKLVCKSEVECLALARIYSTIWPSFPLAGKFQAAMFCT